MEVLRNYPKTYTSSSPEEIVIGDVIYLSPNNYFIFDMTFIDNMVRLEAIEIETNEMKECYINQNATYLIWVTNSLCALMLEKAYGIQPKRVFSYDNTLNHSLSPREEDLYLMPHYELHSIHEESGARPPTHNKGVFSGQVDWVDERQRN